MKSIWLCRYKMKPFIQPMFNTYDEDSSYFDWFTFPEQWSFKEIWHWVEFYIVNKPVFEKYKCDTILIDFKDRKIALAMNNITLVPIQSKDQFIDRVDNDIYG